ncbi:hypothetical protein CRG98_021865 [Punica granatum]|uniref:Uncharacterized protein n=1 Tax=Punica granatum TaxID=22663 RepID=A0A2I0JNE1_PUNGR|nr:hypothetical protein CRG98_021865 [Punica granatum]
MALNYTTEQGIAAYPEQGFRARARTRAIEQKNPTRKSRRVGGKTNSLTARSCVEVGEVTIAGKRWGGREKNPSPVGKVEKPIDPGQVVRVHDIYTDFATTRMWKGRVDQGKKERPPPYASYRRREGRRRAAATSKTPLSAIRQKRRGCHGGVNLVRGKALGVPEMSISTSKLISIQACLNMMPVPPSFPAAPRPIEKGRGSRVREKESVETNHHHWKERGGPQLPEILAVRSATALPDSPSPSKSSPSTAPAPSPAVTVCLHAYVDHFILHSYNDDRELENSRKIWNLSTISSGGLGGIWCLLAQWLDAWWARVLWRVHRRG